MSTQHIVTAAAAKVSVGGAGGNRVAVLLRRGDVLPEGVSEEMLEHLTDRGLIDAIDVEDETDEDEDDDPAGPVDEGPYKGVTVADLKSEIADRNENRDEADKIVPAAPGNRAEIVAALIADDNK